MIEAEVTKDNKTIGQLKDDYVYLLNDPKHILQDRPLEICFDDDNKRNKTFETIDKQKY